MKCLALRYRRAEPPPAIRPEDREVVAQVLCHYPELYPDYVEIGDPTDAGWPHEIRECIPLRLAHVEPLRIRYFALYYLVVSGWSNDPHVVPPPVPVYIERRVEPRPESRNARRRLCRDRDIVFVEPLWLARGSARQDVVGAPPDLPPSDTGLEGAVPLEPVDERNLSLLAGDAISDEQWATLNKRANDVLYRGGG